MNARCGQEACNKEIPPNKAGMSGCDVKRHEIKRAQAKTQQKVTPAHSRIGLQHEDASPITLKGEDHHGVAADQPAMLDSRQERERCPS